MCRSPSTGGTGLTQPGESLAGAGWRGITGQSAGAVTDAPRGEQRGLAAAPAPVPAGTSQGNGKMARQHSARWIAGPVSQSEQPENRGNLHRPTCRHHELPEAAIQGPWVRTYSWRWPGWLRGREQGRQEPLGSCADSCVHTIISNPSEARRLQSVGGSNSTRGRVLILPLCFWRIIRSGGRES